MKNYFKVIGLIILTILIFSVLGWVLRPVSLLAENMAIKSSHQYREGMEQQVAMWEGQLIELENQMMLAQDSEQLAQLEGQKRFINSRINAALLK